MKSCVDTDLPFESETCTIRHIFWLVWLIPSSFPPMG